MSDGREQALLRSNPIFAPAAEASLARLAASSRLVDYRAGELVHSAGDPAVSLYGLGRGRMRVFHSSPSGAQVVVKLFGGPAFFGEGEVFAGIPWLVGLQAVDPSELLHVPPGPFLRFLRGEPECAVRILLDVGMRLVVASYHERSLAFDPSTVRLANYLLDYAGEANPDDAGTWTVALTQEQMAGAIGVTRRSVAKDIADWQSQGILARRGGVYEVLDVAALRRYADPDRLTLSYRLRAGWADRLAAALAIEDPT